MARRRDDVEREQEAQRRTGAVERRLSRLSIVVAPEHDLPGLTIQRDGASVQRALWGSPVPVDPGQHAITAGAPGRRVWSTTVEISGSAPFGTVVEVRAPLLEMDRQAVPAIPAAELRASVPPPAGAVPPSNRQRVLAIAAGAAGVIALGAGTFFVIRAVDEWRDAVGMCAAPPDQCTPGSTKLGGQAGTSADVATGAFIGAAALLGGGLVLWLTAPRAVAGRATPGASVGIVPSPGGGGAVAITVIR